MKFRQIFQFSIGVLFFLLIAGYSYYQVQDFWSGPSITINQPQQGAVFEEPLINITGTAERIAYISLNGRQIFTDTSGVFEEQLLLSPGYNIITVTARDEFHRRTQKQVRLILDATSSISSIYNHGQREI